MSIPSELRRRIGGADIAKLAGLSPWGGPLDVYRRIVEGHQPEQTPVMRMGILLEPVVRALYVAETGAVLAERPEYIVSQRYEFMGGAPDDLRADLPRGVEYKSARLSVAHQWGEPGTDNVPAPYLLQNHWYMALTELPEWDLAVLISTDVFRIYPLQRDEELELGMIELAARFHRDHIVPRRPPAVDAFDSSAEWLQGRFPQEKEPLREATPEEEAIAEELRIAEATLSAAERNVDALRNRMRERIGDAAGLRGAFGSATWKRAKDSHRVKWEDVARALKASAKLIEEHTEIRAGSRRLLIRYTGEQT